MTVSRPVDTLATALSTLATDQYAVVADLVIRELSPVFASAIGARRVRDSVRVAISDLSGSVSPESLPEMATRLACHRLIAYVKAHGRLT